MGIFAVLNIWEMKNKDCARFYCKLPDFSKGKKTVVMEITDNIKGKVFNIFEGLFEVELLGATITLLNAKKGLKKYEFEITEPKAKGCEQIFQSFAFKSIIESIEIINN